MYGDEGSEDGAGPRHFEAEPDSTREEVTPPRDSPTSPRDEDQIHISTPENQELTTDCHISSPPHIPSSHPSPSTSLHTLLPIAHLAEAPATETGRPRRTVKRRLQENQDNNQGGCADPDCDDPEAVGDFVTCNGCAHRVSDIVLAAPEIVADRKATVPHRLCTIESRGGGLVLR